jgi:hypothetical protein
MELMRFDRQEADRKMEVQKHEAQARCDKLQAQLEKGEAKAEMDKRDAQTRGDKLEAKAEIDKLQAQLEKAETNAEMAKRDAQTRCDKLEAKAEMDKRDAQHELNSEMDKRDAQRRCDKLEAKAEMDKRDAQVKCAKLDAKTEKLEAALENEKKDRLVQQQIAQLKWEARPGQTPQLVYSSLPPPVMPVAAVPAPAASPAPAQPSYIPQQNTPANPAVLSPAHLLPHRPPQHHTLPKNMPQPSGFESGLGKIAELKNTQESEPTKPSSQSALTTLPLSPAEAEAAATAAAVTPTAMSVTLSSNSEKPPLPLQQQPPLQQHTSSPPLSIPPSVSARPAQQQQGHRSNKVPVSTGAVPLPDGAQSHFFLSHAQSTGGDQTNAIYLELQQLGFTCW